MKIVSILILLSCSLSVISQTTSSTYFFKYDASGNRIERYIEITPVTVIEDTLIDSLINQENAVAEILKDKDSTVAQQRKFEIKDSTFTNQIVENTDSINHNFNSNTDTFENSSFSKVYPNPTNGIITIEGSGEGILLITTISGQKVYNSRIQNRLTTININNEQPGQYILKIIWNSGKTETWKVTKN